MIEKLQGIVLGTVRHSDTAQIVSVYTPQRGRVPLLMTAGRSKGSNMRRAMTMPLSQVEFSCRYNGARELQRPSSLTLLHPYRTLYFSPVKNAVGIFLTEFLGRLLRDNPGDALTFQYITSSLTVLDDLETSAANFHLVFLSELTTFMGIQPDLSGYNAAENMIFDMRAGRYSALLPGHPDILVGIEADIPRLLSRLTYANMHRLPLSRDQRAGLLSGLLRYWSVHFPTIAALRSPEILCTLFS